MSAPRGGGALDAPPGRQKDLEAHRGARVEAKKLAMPRGRGAITAACGRRNQKHITHAEEQPNEMQKYK